MNMMTMTMMMMMMTMMMYSNDNVEVLLQCDGNLFYAIMVDAGKICSKTRKFTQESFILMKCSDTQIFFFS